jgi:hypothetical protein
MIQLIVITFVIAIDLQMERSQKDNVLYELFNRHLQTRGRRGKM